MWRSHRKNPLMIKKRVKILHRRMRALEGDLRRIWREREKKRRRQSQNSPYEIIDEIKLDENSMQQRIKDIKDAGVERGNRGGMVTSSSSTKSVSEKQRLEALAMKRRNEDWNVEDPILIAKRNLQADPDSIYD